MNQIKINNLEFNYQIQRKPIRSIRLKLLSSDSFIISCPRFTLDSTILSFIKTNSEWILKNSSKINSPPKILNLNKINILNRPYLIKFIPTQRDSVFINDEEQTIYANISNKTESKAKKVLEKRFRTYALTLIKNEIKSLSHQFGFKPQRILVKNQKSRFGSCSSQGNLNFNWQIIFFPYDQFRHILLHELTHLKIKNHSQTFWKQLNIYDPHSKQNNLWLKKEGTKHFII